MTQVIYEVVFKDDHRTTHSPQMTGLELRRLFGLPLEYELIVEGHGDAPDLAVGHYEVVSLSTEPTRIFLRPPTVAGASGR